MFFKNFLCFFKDFLCLSRVFLEFSGKNRETDSDAI
jgi:hypothetical protein